MSLVHSPISGFVGFSQKVLHCKAREAYFHLLMLAQWIGMKSRKRAHSSLSSTSFSYSVFFSFFFFCGGGVELPEFLAFSLVVIPIVGGPPHRTGPRVRVGAVARACVYCPCVSCWPSYRCRAARRRTPVLVRSSSGLVVPSSSPSGSVVSYSAIASRRLVYC